MSHSYSDDLKFLCTKYNTSIDSLFITIQKQLSNAHQIGDRTMVHDMLYDYYLMMFYVSMTNDDDSLYFRLYLNGLFKYRNLEYSLENISKLIDTSSNRN
jgi:hypothetical protein